MDKTIEKTCKVIAIENKQSETAVIFNAGVSSLSPYNSHNVRHEQKIQIGVTE